LTSRFGYGDYQEITRTSTPHAVRTRTTDAECSAMPPVIGGTGRTKVTRVLQSIMPMRARL
jgi:hypothetical protein